MTGALDSTNVPSGVLLSSLAQYINNQLHALRTLHKIRPHEHRQLAALEETIFPGLTGIFDEDCIRRASNHFDSAIILGTTAERIVSYISFFPLTAHAYDICVHRGIKSICSMPRGELDLSAASIIFSIFFEVIVVTEDCPLSVAHEAKRFAIKLIHDWSFLPILSCPASDDGFRLLTRRGFVPVDRSGIDQLHIRVPTHPFGVLQ